MQQDQTKPKRTKKEDVCVLYDTLVQRIADRTDYFKYEVEDVLSGFVYELEQLLLEQDKAVDVKNLGRFKKSTLKAGTMTSNMTGSTVELPERVSCSFQPSRTFKARLNKHRLNNLG